MAKFNIRKATGRQPIQTLQSKTNGDEKNAPVYSVPEPALDKPTNLQVHPSTDLAKNLNDQFKLFESIVSHRYLTKLSLCPIVKPIPEELSNMGWYKITKIILDDDTFFPDQLSMLYTALHDVAKSLALVIEKKGPDDIEIFLGARDISGINFESSKLLENSIQGFLPGVVTSNANDKELFSDKSKQRFVASYSGIASLRDDKKENFIQGLEKFIDATPSIPTFTAIFIADRVSQSQAFSMIEAFSSIENAFSPLAQSQETITESETNGISTTITDTIGETITKTLSKTVTRTEGTSTSYSESESYNEGTSQNESPNMLESFVTSIFGGTSGTSTSTSRSSQSTKQSGKHTDHSEADAKSQANAQMKQRANAKGENSSKTSGSSIQITRRNKKAQRYIDILDRQIERLQNGIPFGLWSVGTYFVTQDSSTSKKLANIYRGCITGEKSDIETSAINVWGAKDSALLLTYLREVRNPRFMVGNINVSASSLATSKELAVHMSLPQASIPGVEVRESATFGRNISSNFKSSDSDGIKIGYISHLGKVSSKEVRLNMDELGKHLFVTGSTGSGKSNTVYLLIEQLLKAKKHVMIVEPTKGDYKKVFGGRSDVTVYGTRIDEKNLLAINPFAFPDNIRVVEHVERLIEIFGVCWPMYAAMPAVLKDSILSAYEACGWNLKTSRCKYGKMFPTISDVIVQLKRIISTSEYSADTKGDYIGALQTRLQSLTNGIYSSIFQSSNPISYKSLYDSNVIIDLHNIGSSETRSLLMGLLVMSLSEWRMSNHEEDMDVKMHHVTILEEAHCILPRVSKQQSQEGSNVLGKSVEMIASAIAEMRTYGESFIIVDQSPLTVDESAIRNTNTKIIMNLPDGDDRQIAGKAMGLTKDSQFNELARLSTGEAVVWQRGWSEAIMCKIEEMKYRNPINKYNNTIEMEDPKQNIPSSAFLAKFFKNDDSAVVSQIEKEIISANCPTAVKCNLLDYLSGSIDFNSIVLRGSIIEYLGLKDYFKSQVVKYSSGSPEFTWLMRDFLSNNLSILDTNIQNALLSQLYIWASTANKKWHTFCVECMPNAK